MNIRSLTRGDGVVIGAAVVLFIASFLDLSGYECPSDVDCSGYSANAWDSLSVLMGIYLAGIIGAALLIVSRVMPGRKVVGFELGQFGAAFTVYALWTMFWTIIDAGDAVLAAVHQSGTGESSGVETELRYFQVWTLRDGKVVRLEGFRDGDRAREAAGLPG